MEAGTCLVHASHGPSAHLACSSPRSACTMFRVRHSSLQMRVLGQFFPHLRVSPGAMDYLEVLESPGRM